MVTPLSARFSALTGIFLTINPTLPSFRHADNRGDKFGFAMNLENQRVNRVHMAGVNATILNSLIPIVQLINQLDITLLAAAKTHSSDDCRSCCVRWLSGQRARDYRRSDEFIHTATLLLLMRCGG